MVLVPDNDGASINRAYELHLPELPYSFMYKSMILQHFKT